VLFLRFVALVALEAKGRLGPRTVLLWALHSGGHDPYIRATELETGLVVLVDNGLEPAPIRVEILWVKGAIWAPGAASRSRARKRKARGSDKVVFARRAAFGRRRERTKMQV
jgi:hypothetical protein